MQKIITYNNKPCTVACDEKCEKAWGINNRPKEQLSEDDDDYAFLSDDELGIAPINPGTYEGGEKKPVSKSEIPNKWCVRECERCESEKGETKPELRDFSKRLYNQPWKHTIEN
jgi:hypothetical protein